MTERQLELREHRRERQEQQSSRVANTHDDTPVIPPCRVLMVNGAWKVPKSQRPRIAAPPADGTGFAPAWWFKSKGYGSPR